MISTFIIPCHEDPRLGEQDITPDDIATQTVGESIRALSIQSLQDGTPMPMNATLKKAAFYPPANRNVQFYGGRMSSVPFSFVRAIVFHSTETSGLPGYQNGLAAPNLSAMPNSSKKKNDWFQHWQLNQSSRALIHPAGVQTNNSNVVQVELVGTTAKGGPGMYLPDAPDWWLDDVAAFVKFMHEQWGVPLQSNVTWESYPKSYGLSNGVRLGSSAWLNFQGVLAHQHVFGNDHGDVFLTAIKEILKRAGASITPPPPPVVHMAFPLSNGNAFGTPSFLSGHGLIHWQRQMRTRGWKCTPTDTYNTQTKAIALAFQKEKGLVADALIGKQTWDAAWTAKVT